MQAQSQRSLTLQGSSQIICDTLVCCCESILFQRGVYPPQAFIPATSYGLTLYRSNRDDIRAYFSRITAILEQLLTAHAVERVVLVLVRVATGAVEERWVFDIKESTGEGKATEDNVRQQIAILLRQIVSMVSFTPVLDPGCSFDLLVTTRAETPDGWADTADRRIEGRVEEISLHSFDTNHHMVAPKVEFRAPANV